MRFATRAKVAVANRCLNRDTHSMRYEFIALTLLMLGACSTSADVSHNQIMDTVEARVRLPSDAGALSDYARYYALGENGNVLITYIVPHPTSQNPTEVCAEMAAIHHKDVCQEYPEFLKTDLSAGKRRWLEDYRVLPVIDDGGCRLVSFEYDVQLDKLTSPACNGIP